MTILKIKPSWHCTLILLPLWFLGSSCIDYLVIDESADFSPCSVKTDVLRCNATNIASIFRNKTVKFTKPNQIKITKVELLNFEMEEIPEHYFRELSASLLSIKIVSKVSIKVIDPQAFVDCKSVTFLEISGLQSSQNFSLIFENVALPLLSLEEIRLVNLNVKRLETDMFSASSNLKSVTVVSQVLSSISTDTFRNNQKLSSLTLGGITNSTDIMQSLGNWPPSSKLSISVLNLDNCNLTAFPQLSIHIAENISQLSLVKNPIERIGLDEIGPLTKLEVLTLTSTKISDKKVPGLKLLTNLKDLKLIDLFTMDDLPKEIETMESLESLYIDMSKFKEITITLPASIRKISATYLQNPSLISPRFLSKCSKLSNLHLMGLPLSSIQFLTANRGVVNSSLNVLSLDHTNLMKNEIMDILLSMSNLESLYLNNVNLNFISNEVLFNLRNLKKLYLSGNVFRYETINTEGFQSVSRHLTHLDLSKNQLRSLPACMFHLFPNLHGLQVLNNPIACDCHMLWLHDVVKRKGIVNHHINFTCSGWPNDVKSFMSLVEKDFKNCSSQMVERCTPSKSGYYQMPFTSRYSWVTSVLTIEDIRANDLGFMFDYFAIIVKQHNTSFHSESEKYDFSRRSIDVSVTLSPANIEVCLILNQKNVEYQYVYNCQTLSAEAFALKGSIGITAGVTAGVGTLVIIVVIFLVIYCRRWRKKREKQHEYYEASSTEYSEPDDTYKSPDQYTYVSDGHYQSDPVESSDDPSFLSHTTLPIFPVSDTLAKLATIPSKSVDVLNSSKTSSDQRKLKFRKRSHIANLISKARSSANLLERPRLSLPGNNISMQDLNNTGTFTLPRQYASRALPQTPLDINIDGDLRNSPPPKPRLSNSSIQNILNNADLHFKNFSQYLSNNSLYTDESANHQHSGDSGLGVSKITANLNQSLSDVTAVVI